MNLIEMNGLVTLRNKKDEPVSRVDRELREYPYLASKWNGREWVRHSSHRTYAAALRMAQYLLSKALILLLVYSVGAGELQVSNQSTGAVRLVVSGIPGATLMAPGTSYAGRFTPDGTNVVQVYEASATNWGPVQVGLGAWPANQIGQVRVWVQEEGQVISDEAASSFYWFFRGAAFGSMAGLGLWVVRWLKMLSNAFERVSE